MGSVVAIEIEEITCNQCNRIWPIISEQGIVTKLLDKCYHCFFKQVINTRNEAAAVADYVIDNCGKCGGLDPARLTCVSCDNKGWCAKNKASNE